MNPRRSVAFAILAESCGKRLLYAARLLGESHPIVGASEICAVKDEFDSLYAQLQEILARSRGQKPVVDNPDVDPAVVREEGRAARLPMK